MEMVGFEQENKIGMGLKQPERCCQSNRNLSLSDALWAESTIHQAASRCHSVSAAERQSL